MAMKTLTSTYLCTDLSVRHGPGQYRPRAGDRDAGGGSPVVMVSLEDWASMEETADLLSLPRNAARFAEAVRDLRAGPGLGRSLVEE